MLAANSGIAAVSVALASALPASAQETIAVPSDSRATYTLVKFDKRPNRIVHITSKRVGPSGESYALREVNCARFLFRYLAEGDTLKELSGNMKYKRNDRMAELVRGSISYHVSDFACRKAGWR